jgi:hypothetical protein
LEEKGLRMHEVKQQRRNSAGMSTCNINKPATDLAKGENLYQASEHNGVDLDTLNRSPSEGLAPANFPMPADFGEPRCLFLLQPQSSQEMRTAFRTPANTVE